MTRKAKQTKRTEGTTMLMHTLKTALTVKRPHGGKGVAMFTTWLEDAVPAHLKSRTFTDNAGNLHVDARTTKQHRTLFVAHVDTVHAADGKNLVKVRGDVWHAYGGVQLGADDGAGVALLVHLLHQGVAGYFIFTQGEERGGIGATFVANAYKSLLAQFDRAIAFDRRGTDSVISHQGWGRCCSDLFAQTLANALNDIHPDIFMYSPDDSGVYTDTAEFVDIIPECTNISVGYYREHTEHESLDTAHLQRLADAVLRINWDSLPTDRDPTVIDEKKWGEYKGYTSVYDNTWWDGDPASWDEYEDMKYYRLDVIDALMDATVGYTDTLQSFIAHAAYPDDPALARKHMRLKNISRDELDYALESVQAGFDVESVLLDLFDMCHVH